MGVFDFVTGDDFRSGLEADYKELTSALSSGSWKAVHVLAGSIIEAVLVDYLVASDYKTRTGTDPLQMTLSDIIDACLKERIISKKIAELSHVVRHYRNLIHPGRLVRLGESVDKDGAEVAGALVRMALAEVSAKRQTTYGYTAEQLVSKIERDPSATAIAGHLLKETNAREIHRLLLKVLPDRHLALADDPFPSEVPNALSRLFRTAFAGVPDELKRQTVRRYTTILKEESGPTIRIYEDAFLTSSDLEHVDEADRGLIVSHIISRLIEDFELPVRIVQGLPRYVSDADLPAFVDAMVRGILRGMTPGAVKDFAKRTFLKFHEVTTETKIRSSPSGSMTGSIQTRQRSEKKPSSC